MKDYSYIKEHEACMDLHTEKMAELNEILGILEENMGAYKNLVEYYCGEEWGEDFESDNRGLIPADIKRGVLSEDGLYNVLGDVKQTALRMLGLATEYLKVL